MTQPSAPRAAAEAPRPGDDAVLPFQLDRADMRGRSARLDRTLGDMLGQHAYPRAVAGLVAEAAMLTALIGQTMKLRWRLSLQIRGDGPIRLIATDWFAPTEEGRPAEMRAYAGFDAERLDPGADAFGQLGQGYFAMIVHQGEGLPYQGLTPLAGNLAASAETYFAQSEQIATRFMISSAEEVGPGGASAWRAGGVMLQHLPPASPLLETGGGGSGEQGALTADDVAAMGGREEDWNRINLLLSTVETHELLGPLVTPEQLLVRLFHEERPRVWAAQPVKFGCTCGPEKVIDAMAQYSAKDIAHMTTEDGRVTADCQFCGARYEFDPAELGFESGR